MFKFFSILIGIVENKANNVNKNQYGNTIIYFNKFFKNS